MYSKYGMFTKSSQMGFVKPRKGKKRNISFQIGEKLLKHNEHPLFPRTTGCRVRVLCLQQKWQTQVSAKSIILSSIPLSHLNKVMNCGLCWGTHARTVFWRFLKTSLKNTYGRFSCIFLDTLEENGLNHTEYFSEIKAGFCSTSLPDSYHIRYSLARSFVVI